MIILCRNYCICTYIYMYVNLKYGQMYTKLMMSKSTGIWKVRGVLKETLLF